MAKWPGKPVESDVDSTYEEYMGEVITHNTSVREGGKQDRKLVKPDPDAPRFSEEAEAKRQVKAIYKADQQPVPAEVKQWPGIPIEEAGQAQGLPATTYGGKEPSEETSADTPFWEPLKKLREGAGKVFDSYNRNIADPFRGAVMAPLTGEYSPKTVDAVFDASNKGDYVLDQTGSPALAALTETGRSIAGSLIDPINLIAPFGVGLMKGLAAIPKIGSRTIPSTSGPVTFSGSEIPGEASPIRSTQLTGQIPAGPGVYTADELLTGPSSKVEGGFYTGTGEEQVPGATLETYKEPFLQGYVEKEYLPHKKPTSTFPAKPMAIGEQPTLRIPPPEERFPQYYEPLPWTLKEPIGPAIGRAQHDPRLMAATDDMPLRVKEKTPRGFHSIFMDAIEKARRIHPSMAKAADHWLDYRQVTEQNAINGWRSIAAMRETGQLTPTYGLGSWEKTMDLIWGRRGNFSAEQLHPLRHYSTQGLWKISREEVDQMVDYIYTEGRLIPTGPNKDRIIASAEAYTQATMEASAHPGVRELQMWDSVGMKWKPLGQPGMFFPHLPLSTKAQQLHGRAYNDAYKRFKERFPEKTVGESDFREFLKKHTGSEDVQGYVGIQQSRLFDAEAVGRPSKVLAEYGYSADPRQTLFNYLNGAYGAGERKLRQGIWSQLEREVEADITDRGVRERVATLFQRMRGSDSELPDRVVGGVISAINNASNAGLLQMSTFAQSNQIIYSVQRGGMANTAKAFKDTLFGKGKDFDTATAANYADLLATLLPTRGLQLGGKDIQFAKLLQAELFVNGFTAMDDILRVMAAKTGDNYLKSLHYGLTKPGGANNKGIRAQLAELGVDADDLLQNGITTNHRMTAAKRFADETQGRRDMRGLPLWATENSTMKRTMLNLKNFMFINMANLRRDIVSGHRAGIPMKTIAARILRGGVAADVTGEITRDILYTLVNQEEPGGKRVPKYARELFGDEGGAFDFSRHVDNLIAGYSAVGLSAMVALAQRDELRFYEFISPPVISIAARMVEDPGRMTARLLGGPMTQRAIYPPKERQSMGLPNPLRLER